MKSSRIIILTTVAIAVAGCRVEETDRGDIATASAAIFGEPGEPPKPLPPEFFPPANLRVTVNAPTRITLAYDCAEEATVERGWRRVPGGAWSQIESGCNGYITDTAVQPTQRFCYKADASRGEEQGETQEVCATVERFEKVDSGSVLDRPRPFSSEIDMMSGREAKIPVSRVWSNHEAPLSGGAFASGHDIQFRTVCTMARSSVGECDTGLIVAYESCDADGTCTEHHTLYNDDDPQPQTHGTVSGTGSWVDPPAQAWGVSKYEVYVFSNHRASSHTRIQYSLNGGTSWTTLGGSDVVVGGTMIDVGALADGDDLEIQTRDDGSGDAGTDMVLFRIDDTAPLVRAAARAAGDADPYVVIAGSARERVGNFVLLGKRGGPKAETFVDLVRGPSSTSGNISLTGCNGPCAATLTPGRYLLSVYATIDRPVGAFDASVPSTHHLSGAKPPIGSETPNPYDLNNGCPTDARDGHGDQTWFRGQPNDMAFDVRVERRAWWGQTELWVPIRTRRVPRGALGTDSPADGWNRILVDLEVPTTESYRVRVTPLVPGVSTFHSWRYTRNPQATELKLVSYNTLFKGNSFDHEKYKNAAHLLGLRGTRTGDVVSQPADQAPYEWEADIIGLQEVSKETEGNEIDCTHVQMIRDELLDDGSLGWGGVCGRGETWFQGWSDGPGMNAVLVNEQHWPTLSPGSVGFGTAVLGAAGCNAIGTSPQVAECELDGIWGGSIDNYATPARATAWRDGSGEDRPFAVFDLHMESDDYPSRFAQRRGELESLIQRIDALLLHQPEAFNRAPTTDAARTSPRHYQNRLVVMGDWNIRTHHCGEHYWMLRRLREHYGYAVIASMATTDRFGKLTLGMHDTGGGYGPDGHPVGYQHYAYDDPRNPSAWTPWRDDPDFTSSSDFPWWATDWRGKTSSGAGAGEKFSMIVLVGRGWAYDDPVIDFAVMSDKNQISPIQPDFRGVEQWRPSSCSDTGAVANGINGYRPHYSLGCDGASGGGTLPGAPALHSDHRPLGVRVRVFHR